MIKTAFKIVLFCLILLEGGMVFAQPANDNPCAATVVAVGSSCAFSGYTNAAATATGGVPAPGCASYSGGDVWFQITVPASGTVTFDSNTGVMTDGGMAIYSGTCGALTLIACNDDGSINGLMPMIAQTGLTPGATIWIRFWEFGNNNNGTFSLCVFDPTVVAPANDNPCSATVVAVGGSCSFSTYTNAGATATGGVPAPGCASYSGGDVWFQITVPVSGNVTFDSNTGVMTDGGMAIYSGTCGALSLIACNDDGSVNGLMPMIAQTGLTPGATIWIRVWEFGNNNNGTFSLCVFDTGGGGAPANDDPCAATVVAVGGSCSFLTYNNTGATATAGAPAPGCANYTGGDVWFQVTVPPSGNLIFDTNIGGITDGGMAIYSGACGALSLIGCNDDGSVNGLMPSISQPGLTPGATIWIRFWEYGNDITGAFDLCVYDGGFPPPAPANDDPCSATVIPVNANCSFSTYTNTNATTTIGVPAPGCASYSGGDVWFQVTVPAAGALTFDTNTGVITDGGMAIYSGVCGALTLIACDDDGSANGAMPMITNGTLTPGSTIWIRIWEFGNNNNGTFQLCVYETTPPPPLPGNVTCAGMEPICSNTPITFTAATGGTPASVANPGNNYGCLITSPNPTWFYMSMLTGGVMAINMSAGSDIDFAMWGPFASLAAAQGNCNSLGAPIDCSFSISATEQANLPAAVAGQVYILLVTNYANVTQVIDLNTAAGNTATTDCSIILPIDLVNIYATVEYTSNTIHWTTLSELSNDEFIIERSYDGTNFSEIGIIDGAGNSSVQNNYQFVDRNFSENLVYYRLKQVDFDGTETHSSIVTVNRDLETVLIYPNPTTSSITIDFPKNQTGNFLIKYSDLMGKEFNEMMELDGTTKSFSSQIFDELPVGIYFVEIRNEAGTLISVQRIVKGK